MVQTVNDSISPKRASPVLSFLAVEPPSVAIGRIKRGIGEES
jgi:hypothetical protein